MRSISRNIFMLLILILCSCMVMQAFSMPQVRNDSIIRERLDSFRLSMQNNSPDAGYYYDLVREYLDSDKVGDSLLISDLFYYSGTYKYLRNSYDEAADLLEKAVRYRLDKQCLDDIYSKARSNLGLSYMYAGNNEKARENLETALQLREQLFGKDSPDLLRTLLNLTAVYIEMNMYGKALTASLRGIQTAEKSAGNTDSETLLKLYFNSSVAYKNQLDFSRARRNSEIALSLVDPHTTDKSMILKIYNSLAVTNAQLGKKEEAGRYFQNALDMIAREDIRGRTVEVVFDNYAFYLLEDGMYDKAQRYLLRSVEDALIQYGSGSRDHILKLLSYSFLLLKHGEDYQKAEEILFKILPYTEGNYHDTRVKTETYLYLSSLMYKTDRLGESLEYIDRVLDDSLNISSRYEVVSLVQKSRVLYKVYSSGSGGTGELEESLSAAEEAIGIIERTRLEINEDESRSRISGRFSDAYDVGILALYELYELTGDRTYLERSINLSERSKAAGLLAATRNNRSMNFRLPEELAEKEKQLLSDIRDYNEVVYTESARQEPDLELIDQYKLLNLRSSTSYDSLVQVFKEDYPRYYDLKYKTGVSNTDDIKRKMGRSGNFIEYYMSDSLLYIFLVNRDTSVLEKVHLSQNFRDKVLDFRDILLNPAINGGARAQYNEYLSLSYDLYKILVLPVRDQLQSDRLVVSPDGLLYYIPFETLISSVPDSDEINYRGLDYLFNDYEIVYEYSGTLMAETSSAKAGIRNKVISFAPDYSGKMDIDDIMMSRQSGRDSLTNIPGAREEAVFINKLLGGKLFLDSQASESMFKRNAADGDIVHMAMHTLLNDTDPMYSRMVFSPEPEAAEDGMLNTYEVYNLDINAKMLFLSSCNTGSGYLQSGEGVMSLARGFFYSGSPCVIMSLWEVDDRSGSAIVKDFYRNIKKGRSKSHSLRRARMDYLEAADQMRSHPYFWGTLVIMGDDAPVYSKLHIYIIGLVFILVLLFILVKKFYHRPVSE
ncbi:MAG: CHAT domain-containing protein [Bacteroidales bacterium]|nr:CHAT domain-containing protein [Bacteroidales bacterium]